MAVVTRFEDLQVWQKARALNKDVYQMTRAREFSRDYAMVDQFRRASISTMNNIAEGFERYRRTEFLQFLSISKGSAGEVRSMLYAAHDVGYIDEAFMEDMLGKAVEMGASIGRFRSGLERSPSKTTATSRAKR